MTRLLVETKICKDPDQLFSRAEKTTFSDCPFFRRTTFFTAVFATFSCLNRLRKLSRLNQATPRMNGTDDDVSGYRDEGWTQHPHANLTRFHLPSQVCCYGYVVLF